MQGPAYFYVDGERCGGDLEFRIVTPPFLGYLTALRKRLYVSMTNFPQCYRLVYVRRDDGITDSVPATVSIALFPQSSNTKHVACAGTLATDPSLPKSSIRTAPPTPQP